jgi:hypothetical protein
MTGFVTGGEGSEGVLNSTTHEAVDHTVGPLSLLDSAAHALVSHIGLPGVPAAEAFTSGAHSATNHTGISGVGDLSTAAHAVLNHVGIPGIGLQSSSASSGPSSISSFAIATGYTPKFAVFLWDHEGVETGVGICRGTGALQAFAGSGSGVTLSIIGTGAPNWTVVQFDATQVRITGGPTNVTVFGIALG